MTDLRKAAEMALEALERGTTGLAIRAIPALRQALAQPEQEPVDIHCPSCLHSFSIVPVAKPWVGLTDEEIGNVYVAWDNTDGASFADFARLIETKSRSKNNG